MAQPPLPLTDRPPTRQAGSPPPRDWGKASWGDVLQHGLSTFGPAAINDAVQTGKSIWHAGQQFGGAEPSAPGAGRILSSALRAATGQGAPIAFKNGRLTYAGPTMADFRKAPSDIAQGVGNVANYYGSYLSEPGLKRHLATDMPGVALDAGLLASAAEGGEGALAARAATIENAARAARLGAAVPVMRGVGAGVRAVAPVIANPVGRTITQVRGGPVFTRPGVLNPDVATHLDNVAPGSSAELSTNTPFRNHVVKTMGQNGVNEPAAREALVTYGQPDSPAPRGPIMQQRPPPAAAQATKDAIADAHQANGAKMGSIAASPPPLAGNPGYPAPWAAADASDRRALLNTDTDTGKFAPTYPGVSTAQDLSDFTQTPEGQRLFTPQEGSDIRLGVQKAGVLDGPMYGTGGAGSRWPAIRQGALTVAGAVAAPHVPVLAGLISHGGELAGAGMGFVGGNMLERLKTAATVRGAEGGARAVGGPWLDVPAWTSQYGQPFTKAAPIARALQPDQQGAEPAGPAAATPAAGFGPAETPDTPAQLPPAEGEEAPPPKPLTPDEIKAGQKGLVSDPHFRPEDGEQPDAAVKLAPAEGDETNAPASQADGGRVGYAAGGEVVDLTQKLLKRAEGAQRAARASTKPILGLSDDVVAQALRVAQRGL